ncbi:MAG: NTP transferase domain-containing protein [Candidatus Omnitrophica bacterium]|nr:NTP transferase domain-containing protein [Candidatus Omnitrophota bacterium]
MKELRTIILAAGKGTRMKSDIPKVLHALCGKPMIQYVLDIALALGSLRTYVVLGHKSGMVKKILGDKIVTVEQPKMLGTADAVKRAEKYFRSYHGDILILCADTPLLDKTTVKKIVQKHKKAKTVCTFLTAVVHNPKGYGRVIRGTNGNVVAIREDKDAAGFERDIAEINVGVYCCQGKELFKALKEIKINKKKKEFYLTDIIEYFFEKGLKMSTVETEDPAEGLGVNTREDLAAAEAIMRRKILKYFMLEGVTIVDPSTTYVHANARIGYDTVIHPFSFIEADVRIGSHCKIGPFARIRSGTKIDDKVEIGNFTEVSRSKVGSGTFMKHFSYVGDSSVGENVNIGAGMVTANFDGRQKHPTKIADGAFIGSGSILVAPAKIGKKAVIGAGSVVLKGKTIPDGSVAVGVPAKIISKKERQ